MNTVGGLLVCIFEGGLFWYASPAFVGAKRKAGLTALVVCVPLSWPWVASRGTKARLARMDDED